MRALVVLTALALASCSVAPATAVRYHRIEVPAPAAAASAVTGTLVVEPFEVFGVYSQRPLLFQAREATSALEQYHYALWAEPPSVMLRDSLVAYLGAAFAGAQVVPAGGRKRADLTVHARLKRFEHVLGATPQAALAIEFRVADAADNERARVSFDEQVAAQGGSVEDYVAAMDRALAKAYAALVEQMGGKP